MLKFGALGAAVGGVLGTVFGYRQSCASSELETDSLSADSSLFVGKEVSPNLRSTLEKLASLCSPQGREIVTSITSIMNQISAAVEISSRESDSKNISDNIRMVQLACTRAGRGQVLLERLFDVEKSRFGNSDEFKTYRGTIEIELKDYSSALNNFLTKNLLKLHRVAQD
jgi:hypothetical protein